MNLGIRNVNDILKMFQSQAVQLQNLDPSGLWQYLFLVF